MKIKDLFESEERWTQGGLARNEYGDFSLPSDSESRCWCLFGALCKVYGPRDLVRRHIKNQIKEEIGDNIISWNDAPERTFDDVKSLVEKLDI